MAQIEETKVIPLRKPIEIGQGEAKLTYSELNLREPTMGELKQAHRAGAGLDMLSRLIQLVGGWPVMAVDQLPQRAVEEAGRFFGQFSDDQSSTSSPPEEPGSP